MKYKVWLNLIVVCALLVPLGGAGESHARTSANPANDHWMADLEAQIKDLTLATVILPGTHDSGTYGIKWDSAFAPPDCVDPGIKRGIAKVQEFCDWAIYVPTFTAFCIAFNKSTSAITAPWAKAQGQSIADQLAGGVRYFDLRFFPDDGKLKIHHTLVGPDSDTIFDEVETFVRADGHGKEIVILDLRGWCNMEAEDHKRLVATLYERFRDLMIPNDMLGATLNDLWLDKLRVIIRYDEWDDSYATGAVDPDLFWTEINSKWLQAKDDYNGSILLPKMAARLPLNDHSQLFVLQGVVTPDTDMVSWGLKCTLAPGLWPSCKDRPRPTSLRKVAETITPKVSNSVYDWCEDCLHSARDNLNIITVDFYELGPLVQRVKEINQGTYNTAPTVDAGPDLVGKEGHPVDLDVPFEDSDTCDRHSASVDWGDGTTEDLTVPQGSRSVASSHTYADNGEYTVTVCVRDRFDEACDDLVVTVENVAPTITATGDTIDENGVATISGTITDPGKLDWFTLVIDWGKDEGTETFEYDAGTEFYSETHHYLDDNPSGTPSDDYPINVTVTDKDDGQGNATTTVTVNNLDPVASIDSITDETGAEIGIGKDVPAALVGLKVDVAGSFTDVGTLDTHTAVIDWGDGSTSAGTVTETDGSGSVTGTHVYNDPGDYTMTLTVTDDDHGEGTESADIKVVDAEGGITTVIEQLASLPDDPNIAAALDKLRGEKGGQARNGALDMLEKDDLNAALEKIKQALQYLEAAEAADPDLDLTSIKGFLAVTAKSVAVGAIAQADAVATRPKDRLKIEQANGLVAQGDMLLAELDYVGAVDKYQQAVRKVQGML